MSSKQLLTLASSLKQVVRHEHAARPLSVIYPRLGNRDIVGHGINGMPHYIDTMSFPAPAVRFKENSKEVLSLREKEKGPWKELTLLEKKALYRASFCKTYAEMNSPDGRWKKVMSIVFSIFAISLWVNIFYRKFVLPELPTTITEEWRRAQLEKMVRQRIGHVDGVSSKWDYENNKWK